MMGDDPRDRVFNTQKQAGMYDKRMEFRDLWLEEVEAYPTADELVGTYF